MTDTRPPGSGGADGRVRDESSHVAPTSRAVASTLKRGPSQIGPGLRFVDLFSGVGGLSLGCMWAGLVPLAAFDNDPEAISRYETNLGPHAHKLDLSDASAETLLAFTGGVKPDVVVGGPPCQGFSSIGKRDPLDPRSALTRSFARIVAELRPAAFAMENVLGIMSMGTIANELREFLRAIGYANADWVVLNAADFGVPQKRLRAVLLGALSGAKPTADALKTKDAQAVTVREALRGLPRPRARSTLRRNAFVPYPGGAAEPGSYEARMRNPTGAVSGCQLTIHDEVLLGRFKTMRGGDVDSLTSYRRLVAGGLAPALRAGSRRRTACRPLHPFADRVITVREASRLHSFPDAFDFSEVVSLAHVQIGNSVPPLMATGIARWLAAAVAQQEAAPAAAASA